MRCKLAFVARCLTASLIAKLDPATRAASEKAAKPRLDALKRPPL
jgi:hypothetical protein